MLPQLLTVVNSLEKNPPMVSGGQGLSQLRQERSRRTRHELVRAAERLWRKKGFDATTVSEICTTAGVAKGTFYFYFQRKQDLLLELGLSTADRVREEMTVDDAHDLPLVDLLRTAVAGFAVRTSRTPPKLLERTIVELYRHSGEWPAMLGDHADLYGIFAGVFTRARERGEVPPEREPDELASVVATTLLNGMLRWARDCYPGDELEDVLWRRVELILYGLVERS